MNRCYQRRVSCRTVPIGANLALNGAPMPVSRCDVDSYQGAPWRSEFWGVCRSA